MKSFRDGLIAAVNEHMHGKLGWLLGVIHNPRGQLMGEGVSQINILLHKSYFVKVITQGEGARNIQKFDHLVYGWLPARKREIVRPHFFQFGGIL